MIENFLPAIYLLASVGFIMAVKWMNNPATARRGVIIGEIGMLLAVIGTLLRVESNFAMIFIGIGRNIIQKIKMWSFLLKYSST